MCLIGACGRKGNFRERNIKRALNILKGLIIGLVILIVLVTVLLLLPPVQTFLANKAAGLLKTEFNITASVGGVRFYFPNKLRLVDLYIEDDHNDTLIYAQKLTLHYSGFNKITNTLNSSRVLLENGRLYMRKYPQDSLFNFAIFLEKLSTGEPDTAPAKPFHLKISSIEISEFRFTKHRLGCTDTCTNIFLTDANIRLTDFQLNDGYVTADLRHMRYTDANRFSLHDLKTKVAYQADHISFTDLYFKTDASEVQGEATLEFGEGDFDDFLERVRIHGKFVESTFSSNEFKSYLSDFPQFDVFKLSGNFNGTVNHFDVKNCKIELGNQTRFAGELHIDEPTESSLLHIKTRITQMRTTPQEFRKYVGQFTGQMEWMDFLDQFKSFGYKGTYEGTIKDFDVKGDFAFDENLLEVDAHMNDFDDLEKTTYRGVLASEGIDIKKILGVAELGMVKFNTTLSGTGLTEKTLDADIEGEINYIDLNGYRFQHILVDGHVKNRNFDGLATVRDPNLGLDFAGNLDFSGDTILSDFKTKITNANVFALGYSEAEVAILNLEADIDFDVYKDNWWDGTINIFNITYESIDRFYFFDTLQLASTNVNNVHHDRVKSRLLSAEINGQYDLPNVFNAFYAEYLDFNRLTFKTIVRPQVDFTYDVNLHNTELLTDIFLPQLAVEAGSILKGEYKGSGKKFDFTFSSALVQWEKLNFKNINIKANHQTDSFNVNARVGTFAVGKQLVDSVLVEANLVDDSLWFATKGIFRDSIDSYFRLKGHAFDVGNEAEPEYTFYLSDGRFNIGTSYFDLIPNNFIHFKKGEVELQNVGFFDDKSAIVVHGYKSNDPNKILRVSAENLDAELLNYLIRYKALNFKGRMSGDVVISYESNMPRFASNLGIDSLFINDDFLGNLALESNWDIQTSVVGLQAELSRQELKMLTADGTYYPDSTGRLDFDIHFDRFRLMWANPFVEGILEKIRGTITGDVKLTGTFDDIQTEGELILSQVALGVPFFATDYGIEGKPVLKVMHNRLELEKATIRDTKEGTTGNVALLFTHNNFNDWNMSLEIDSKNLLVLNTQNTDDAYFYGKGYVAGAFSIKGPFEDLDINVDITTNKGTDFKIPFSNPVNVGNQSFVTYTGRSNGGYIVINPEEIEERLKASLGGLDVSINAKITPDASIELVMDETVGDIIKGRGEGDLRINIPHDGDMTMYGTVEITSGEYLFTMRNIINKKFVVIPGGTITWRGSPYEALVDMKAKYTTRTTLTGMVYNNYDGQRVQVDLIMDLKGLITNPNINFAINLPNSNASYQEELNNRLSDPDKLNVQAFSLLIMNSFWTESVSTESNLLGQTASSNTMQMATAQFSNWLGQGIGNYIDISLGYNTASGDQLSNELEIDVSKPLFDDRIIINSKIDVPVGASTAGTAQTVAGDIEVIYKITTDGRIRAKAFNRNNQDNPALDKLSPYTQGIGIFYQTSYNTFKELLQQIFGKKPEEQNAKKEE